MERTKEKGELMDYIKLIQDVGFGCFIGVGIFFLFKTVLEKVLETNARLLETNARLVESNKEISLENKKAIEELTKEIRKISERK